MFLTFVLSEASAHIATEFLPLQCCHAKCITTPNISDHTVLDQCPPTALSRALQESTAQESGFFVCTNTAEPKDCEPDCQNNALATECYQERLALEQLGDGR